MVCRKIFKCMSERFSIYLSKEEEKRGIERTRQTVRKTKADKDLGSKRRRNLEFTILVNLRSF